MHLSTHSVCGWVQHRQEMSRGWLNCILSAAEAAFLTHATQTVSVAGCSSRFNRPHPLQ